MSLFRQRPHYGLGATLYHLLSGDDPSDHPFLFKPLSLPAAPALAALITQMLEQDKTKRPADMLIVERELERIADELATGQKWASAAGMTFIPQAPLVPNPPMTPYRALLPSNTPLPQVMTATPVQPNYLTLEELAIIAYATQDVPHKDRLATLTDWQRSLASSQATSRTPQRTKDAFIERWTIVIIVLLIIACGLLFILAVSPQ